MLTFEIKSGESKPTPIQGELSVDLCGDLVLLLNEIRVLRISAASGEVVKCRLSPQGEALLQGVGLSVCHGLLVVNENISCVAKETLI